MENVRVKIVFDRRSKATATKKASVEIEIYFNGKRRWISTGIQLLKSQWSDRTHVKGVWNASQLNTKIVAEYTKVNNFINDLQAKGEPFSFDRMDSFFHRVVRHETFLDFVRNRIMERPDIKEGTRKHHVSFLNILRESGVIKHFYDLNTPHIVMYDDYLHRRGIRKNTIISHHKMMKTYIHQAIRLGKLEKDPYINFKVESMKAATRNYLTIKEFIQLRDAELSGTLEKARDLFLFLCYTALSYEDGRKFDFERDAVNDGDRWMFSDFRVKTDEDYYIVLIPDCMELLKKWNYKLPWMSNQKLNLYLKAAAAQIGLTKEPTSHWGRHTAAMIALNGGIDISRVSRMLAHSNVKTTKIYAHMMQDTMNEAYDKMSRLWNKKKG